MKDTETKQDIIDYNLKSLDEEELLNEPLLSEKDIEEALKKGFETITGNKHIRLVNTKNKDWEQLSFDFMDEK